MFSGTTLVRMLRLKWYVRYVQVFSATIKLRHNGTAGKQLQDCKLQILQILLALQIVLLLTITQKIRHRNNYRRQEINAAKENFGFFFFFRMLWKIAKCRDLPCSFINGQKPLFKTAMIFFQLESKSVGQFYRSTLKYWF